VLSPEQRDAKAETLVKDLGLENFKELELEARVAKTL